MGKIEELVHGWVMAPAVEARIKEAKDDKDDPMSSTSKALRVAALLGGTLLVGKGLGVLINKAGNATAKAVKSSRGVQGPSKGGGGSPPRPPNGGGGSPPRPPNGGGGGGGGPSNGTGVGEQMPKATGVGVVDASGKAQTLMEGDEVYKWRKRHNIPDPDYSRNRVSRDGIMQHSTPPPARPTK